MLKFAADNNANNDDIDFIESKLSEFNHSKTGIDRPINRALYLKEDGEIVGGIVFVCMKPWAFVKLFWISEPLRGKGHGAKLLSSAEDYARKNGSTKIMLDTFSFQAPQFYRAKP